MYYKLGQGSRPILNTGIGAAGLRYLLPGHIVTFAATRIIALWLAPNYTAW